MKIYRNDIYVRSETGGEWFEEFLQSFAESKAYSLQNMLDTMNQKKGQSVENIVNQYKEMVGLETMADQPDANITSTVSNFSRPISIRHAEELESKEEELESEESKTILLIIKENPEIDADIHSLCENSGGTKNTHSIISFLRESLGNELVSYNDDDLVQYIDDVKKQYYVHTIEPLGNAGRVGLDDHEDSNQDNVADFIEHGKGH